ncbi:MAG: HDOD domain-containing protein [Archangiaceae bacterium]|nr:HDOD domain-containing protein [Archangiaceae bacterium]
MYPPAFDRGQTLPAGLEQAFAEKVKRLDLELPVLPEAAATILQETQKESWSVQRVVSVLGRDTSMATHLLRIANSPAFAGGTPVVSIQQAITRLGASQLRQLAVVIACETAAFVARGFENEVRAALQHSLAVGLCAKEIARQRRANVEEAFLAGLLHDLGWPVAVHALVRLGAGPHVKHATLEHAERVHATLGAAVARAWRLPESIAKAIAAHHDPHADDALTATIALADVLVRRTEGEPFDEAQLLELPATQVLNLYPDVVHSLAKRGAEVFQEAARW